MSGSPPDFYDEIGRRIAVLRRSRSWSQEHLAERAGVGSSTVSHIEIGSVRPSLEILQKLAGALRVPLWRLITDDRMSHDERTWDAASRGLAEKVRGLDAEDMRALSYLAARLQQATGGAGSLRAAETRGARWRGSTRKKRAAKRRT
ncbi:MAG: helix-turn-helix domain-containing protein [Deltaproteobacteria bacterium]|nr:helix-turn-helix domain-containing protein [Deltaproteobacteria bacterium]